jgi:mannose-6-phosphate isomerase-like protein (cupin superfamily)
MAFRRVLRSELEWTTRPHEPDESPRHIGALSDLAGLQHSRANLWRYEPGAKGRRHRDLNQEETFVPIAGTLTMYLGDPPERVDAEPGDIVHVGVGTPLQVANHGEEELLLFIYGAPPETGGAEFLDSAV